MKAFLGLIAALCMTHGVAQAQCPDMIGRIEVSAQQIQPELNLSTPQSELTIVGEMSRPGLTDGLTDIQFDSKIDIKEGPKVNGCPVSDLTARLVTTRAVVYIAREIPDTLCRHRAVLDHELEHVQIAQRSMDAGAKLLKELLQAAPIQFHPPTESAPAGVVVMRPWLQQQAAEALRYAEELYNKGNNALDQPEEASRLANMCDDTITYQVGGRIRKIK